MSWNLALIGQERAFARGAPGKAPGVTDRARRVGADVLGDGAR